MGRAALPCIHHPRLAATLINRVILAGLHLAARITEDLTLRARLRRLAQSFQRAHVSTMDITPVQLNRQILTQARRALDRRTVAYRPALTLVTLLSSSAGLLLDDHEQGVNVPGFLFDMNRFFQALLARFLRDHLVGYTMYEEQRLKGMMDYLPGYNPRHRRAPQPRPDYVIQREGRTVALLDAKYRDLWEQSFPRSMLYQLAIYAMSQGPRAKAVILYPTLDGGAVEARIAIRDPLQHQDRAYVVLRPVHLFDLERLIASDGGRPAQRAREAFARRLVFGDAGLLDR
jgi:5-methylcytosine-specific restriction enzyme subunit McrC